MSQVPDVFLGRVSPMLPMPGQQTFDVLINSDSKHWDEDTVNGFFALEVVEKILHVPFPAGVGGFLFLGLTIHLAFTLSSQRIILLELPLLLFFRKKQGFGTMDY